VLDERVASAVEELLNSPNRVRFLSLLGGALSTAARNTYEVGLNLGEASVPSSFNEMFIVIFKQLDRSTSGGVAAYPDDVFINLLFERAQQKEIFAALVWAFRRVFEDLDPRILAALDDVKKS
jgi:hypothetical protein